MRSTFLAMLLLAAPLFGGEGRAAAPPAQADQVATTPPPAASPAKKDAKAARKPKAPRKGQQTKTDTKTDPGKGKGNGSGRTKATRVAKTPPAHLLRSGFRTTEVGSEVVLQTSAEVELETIGTEAAPAFLLRRCRAVRANDRRPLDTRFFGTTVTGVALRQRGRDLIVRVTLKGAAAATTRKERGAGDSWTWILAFATASGEAPAPASPQRSPQPLSAPTAAVAATADALL